MLHATLHGTHRQRQTTAARQPRQRQDTASRPPRQAVAVYAGQRFSGFADFQPAFLRAKEAAVRAHGDTWYLVPHACITARVPGKWCTTPIGKRVCASVRDLNMPAAEFWDGGKLPVGPVYQQPLGTRRLASIKLASIVTGAEAEMHPYEAVAWLCIQEERARKMRNRIASDGDRLAAD